VAKVRIGVSGWSYDGWSGVFYPEDLRRSHRLEYIARRFSTVEVNGSFYSLLRPDTYRGWYDCTPRRFRFAVKGSRFITHNRKLRDVEVPLANFFASGPLALREKLGPFLWQFPAALPFDEERARSFFALLPADTEEAVRLARRHDDRVERTWLEPKANHRVRHAIEPRHPSWFCAPFVRIARRAGVVIVFADSGDWPSAEELTAGFAYLRLHGSPQTYASGYGEERLDRLARRIRAWAAGEEPGDARRITDRVPPPRKGRDVYVYFDNDREGRAPRDALALAGRIDASGSG